MSVRDYNLDSNLSERLNKSSKIFSTSQRNLKASKESFTSKSKDLSKKQITFSRNEKDIAKNISENFFRRFQTNKFIPNNYRNQKIN